MDEDLRNRLLGSIAGHRLTLLVGAGLSMSQPSGLPAAWRVANACFDAFVDRIGPLPIGIRDDLEEVAEEIRQKVDFRNVFIRTLVPWGAFVAPPNQGHMAVADLLLSGGAQACLSANYDMLVETAGNSMGADFQSALSGPEATELAASQSPLLKFHGCMTKDRDRTVWTREQFANDPILEERRASNVIWMRANLERKDILIIGFWSDWAYLNEVFAAAFEGVMPLSITIVDPLDRERLQEKAPALWALANQANVEFTHVQALSHEFLGALQNELGRAFFRMLLRAGADAFATFRPGTALPVGVTEPPPLSNTAYYAWRRDAAGVTPREAVRDVQPNDAAQVAGLAHVLVRNAGGVAEQNGYVVNGTTVRVINGGGKMLSEVRDKFAAGPAVVEADVIICAGATDFGVVGNIIRDQQPATTVRQGVEGRWLSLPAALEVLAL